MDRLGQRRYTPRGLPAKPVGRLSDVGIVRLVPARRSIIFLQVNHPMIDAFENRTFLPACSMRAASEPTELLGGSASGTSKRRAPRGPQASRPFVQRLGTRETMKAISRSTEMSPPTW